ncbi:hypothetical protein LCGC14_2307450, partial [marine sediment metagenome]
IPEMAFINATNGVFRAMMPARAGALPLLGAGLAGGLTYQQTGNIPLSIGAGIVGLKAAGRLYSMAPKTFQQAATHTSAEGQNLWIALAQNREGPLAGVRNSKLMSIPIQILRSIGDDAIKIHKADPALGVSFSKMARLGRFIFDAGNTWIDKTSIKPLLAKLYDDAPVTRRAVGRTLEKINAEQDIVEEAIKVAQREFDELVPTGKRFDFRDTSAAAERSRSVFAAEESRLKSIVDTLAKRRTALQDEALEALDASRAITTSSPLLKAQTRFGTKESLTSINDMLHWLRGSNVKNITENEAIERLAAFLGGNKGSLADRSKVVKAWVNTWRDGVYAKGSEAVRSTSDSTLAMKRYGDNARETFLTNARSDVLQHVKANAWIRSSQRNMDRLGQLAMINFVESKIVYPFSRFVLFTLTYGVLNIFEAGFRSLFSMTSPIGPRGMSATREWIRVSRGLTNRPYAFVTAAMNKELQVISPIAAVPASATEATYGVSKVMSGPIPFVTKDVSAVISSVPGMKGTRIERWSKKIPSPLQSFASLNRWAGSVGTEIESAYLLNKLSQNIEKMFPAEAALA